ncbi:MAG: hypothetical protein AAF402_07645 [Pseudomonadota bacterium]
MIQYKLITASFCTLLIMAGFSHAVFSQGSTETTVASDTNLVSIELKDSSLGNAIRVLSELSGLNIVATNEAANRRVTVFLKDTSIEHAIDTICRITGLWYRYNDETGVYIIMTTQEYSQDVVVYRQEHTRTFALKHHNVSAAAEMIEALFGDRVEITTPGNSGTYTLDGDVDGGNLNSAISGSTSSSLRDNNRNRRNNRNTRSRSQRTFDEETAGLDQATPAQLDQLELGRGTLEQLGEDALGSISQLQPPIFVTFNELHKLLFVRTGDKAALDEISTLVKAIDLPTRQVLLQMKILRVTLGEEERSVFDFSYSPDDTETLPASSFSGNDLEIGGGVFPEQTLGLGNNALEGGTLVYQVINNNLLFRMQLLEAEGRVETLATPLVLASDTKAAEIFLGEERVMVRGLDVREEPISGTDNTRTIFEVQTELEQVGNLLKIWPRINDDRTVTLDIEQEISSVNPGATSLPVGINGTPFPIDSKDTSSLNLTAIARDGLSIAVGGMISYSNELQNSKVPVLGDIPVLGKLFRRDEAVDDKSELILMVTPYIMDSPEEAERVKAELAKNEYSSDLIDKHLQDGLVTKTVFEHQLTKEEFLLASYIRDAWELAEYEQEWGGLEEGLVWNPQPSIRAQALASWQMGAYYVTVAQVERPENDRSRGPRPINLDAAFMGLGWTAVAFDQPTLSPGQSLWVTLISRTPFDVALQQIEPVQ